jgi:hypothetical protein
MHIELWPHPEGRITTGVETSICLVLPRSSNLPLFKPRAQPQYSPLTCRLFEMFTPGMFTLGLFHLANGWLS